MSALQQMLGAITLTLWVALWWLAIRIVFSSRFGVFEWVPVALVSFAVPMLAVDLTGDVFAAGLLAIWGGIAVAIDLVWVSSHLRRKTYEMFSSNTRKPN